MRRLTFVGILTLAATVGCDSAMAPDQAELGSLLDPDGNAVAQLSTLAQVTGSGHVRRADGGIRKFTISAIQHADGSVSGEYDLMAGPIQFLQEAGIHPPQVSFHGTITCMTVVGNSAYLGGVVDRQKNALIALGTDEFSGVAIELIDNGNGPDAEPDQISSVAFYLPGSSSTPQDYCDAPTPGTVFPIEQGNITVH